MEFRSLAPVAGNSRHSVFRHVFPIFYERISPGEKAPKTKLAKYLVNESYRSKAYPFKKSGLLSLVWYAGLAEPPCSPASV